jgi:ribonuclease HII
MIETAGIEFSRYDFDLHKGYGTKKHYENIERYGICPIHRKTFLKKYFLKEDSLFG